MTCCAGLTIRPQEKEDHMNRSRRALAALLLVGLFLSACSLGGAPEGGTPTDAAAAASPDANAGEAEAGGVVAIGFGAQSFERQMYEPLIEEFNRQNPDVQVAFVSLDEANQPQEGEEFDIDTVMRRTVSAADTAVSYFLRPEDIAKGYVYDLKPLIDADPNFDAGDFYPGTLEQYARDGGQYMLPRSTRIQLLSYNKELWARKGLPPPDPNWTMRDMLAAAEQLATKRADEVEVYGLVDWSGDYTALFAELNAVDIDLFARPSDELRLDDPAIVGALERVRALVESGAIYAQPRSADGAISSTDFQKLIEDGRGGMWQQVFLFGGPDAQQPAFEVGTLPYPAQEGPFAFGGGEGYIMSAGTQHPEAAWRWLSFLSKQPVTRPFAGPDVAGELPARKSIAEQTGYWNKLDEEARAAVEAIVARPFTPPPAYSPDPQLFAPLIEALSAVIGGEKQPEQALRDAQARLEELRAQAQLTPTAAAETGPIVVATPRPAVAAAPDATTINFGSLPGLGGPDAIRKLADSFNQSQAEIFVQVKDINFGPEPVTLDDIAASHDCFSWWGPPQPSEITATLDLQPLIDGDPSFDRGDYPAALLAPFRHGAALHGLPTSISFRILSYNQTAFDAAGIAYPSANWTIDDLIDAAQQLTTGSDENKQYGFVSLGNQVGDLEFFLRHMGASPTTGSGESQQPNLTNPKLAQAVRAYLDMVRTASPDTQLQGYKRGSWSSESYNLVSQGRAAMWFDYGFGFSSGLGGQPTDGFEVAIAPPPLSGGPIGSEDFFVRGMFISAASQHAEECWAWLKTLSADAANVEGDFPARISAAESPAFLGKAPDGAAEVYAAYRAAFDRASPDAANRSWLGETIDPYWFYRAVDRALQGEDLDRELADAQALTERFAECVRATDDAAACATQVDPEYEGWRSEGA
jgi:multiple sugar transport system substrate-binding protein